MEKHTGDDILNAELGDSNECDSQFVSVHKAALHNDPMSGL
jgi:hypothetical protein